MRTDSVSFDFDGTLSKPIVQKYCKELIARGIDVWVVTSRYDLLNFHRYSHFATHNDLFEVLEEVGLPKWKVVFTNFINKAEYLKHTKVLWHLDDDFSELNAIRHHCPNIKGIQVNSGSWKQKCEKLLQHE